MTTLTDKFISSTIKSFRFAFDDYFAPIRNTVNFIKKSNVLDKHPNERCNVYSNTDKCKYLNDTTLLDDQFVPSTIKFCKSAFYDYFNPVKDIVNIIKKLNTLDEASNPENIKNDEILSESDIKNYIYFNTKNTNYELLQEDRLIKKYGINNQELFEKILPHPTGNPPVLPGDGNSLTFPEIFHGFTLLPV
ncbi:MAG: hypothetical protein H7839_03995 [Magnetococcus sp. YQC-5]